jgi:hypothetical protein
MSASVTRRVSRWRKEEDVIGNETAPSMHDEFFMEEDMLLELAQAFKKCHGDFKEFV